MRGGGARLKRCAVTMTLALTTIRQPCTDIAHIAYNTLRERMSDASMYCGVNFGTERRCFDELSQDEGVFQVFVRRLGR